MNKREPTMQDALRQLDRELSTHSPQDFSPKPQGEHKTMLQSIADALIDLRYDEMMTLAAGIKPDESVPNDVMAQHIHAWAKNYSEVD